MFERPAVSLGFEPVEPNKSTTTSVVAGSTGQFVGGFGDFANADAFGGLQFPPAGLDFTLFGDVDGAAAGAVDAANLPGSIGNSIITTTFSENQIKAFLQSTSDLHNPNHRHASSTSLLFNALKTDSTFSSANPSPLLPSLIHDTTDLAPPTSASSTPTVSILSADDLAIPSSTNPLSAPTNDLDELFSSSLFAMQESGSGATNLVSDGQGLAAAEGELVGF